MLNEFKMSLKKKNAFTKDSVQDFSINTAFAPQLRTQAKTWEGLVENMSSYLIYFPPPSTIKTNN